MSCGSTTCTPPPTRTLRPADPVPLRLPGPFGWFRLLVELQSRWRRREELRELDDRILRDVGLTRDQVAREARAGLLWEY